jgi:hypothetical protein
MDEEILEILGLIKLIFTNNVYRNRDNTFSIKIELIGKKGAYTIIIDNKSISIGIK